MLTKTTIINILIVLGIFISGGMFLLEFKSFGYVTIRDHIFYGENAKYIAWSLFLCCLFIVIISLHLIYRDIKKKTHIAPNNHLANETHICVTCDESFYLKEDEARCPFCQSYEIEHYKGFYNRHPLRGKNQNEYTLSENETKKADLATKIFVGFMLVSILVTLGVFVLL